MKVDIRQEKTSDFKEIYEIIRLAFKQDDEPTLVDHLRNSDSFIPALSLVAFLNNEIVGHILFTKIKIRNENGDFCDSLALAPLAVRPDLQRQGIGGQLIRHGLNLAKELGHNSVIVLGHEHYYPKFGFVPTEKWNIKSPFNVSSNVFMGIELVRDAFNGVSGTVQYPKEFDSF